MVEKSLPTSWGSSAIHVVEDSVLGLRSTEILRKMQEGVGHADPVSSKFELSADHRSLRRSGKGSAVGGLRTYLHEDIGNGYWDFIGVCPGLLLSITDAVYHKSHRIVLPSERLVKIRIVTSGTIVLPNNEGLLTDGSAVIHQIGGSEPAEYVIGADETRLQMVVLHALPEALQNLGLTTDILPKKLLPYFGFGQSQDSVFTVAANAKLNRIAREILESRDQLLGEMRLTYVRGKSYELLCEAVLRSIPTTVELAGGNRFRRSDIMRLHEAKRIVGNNLEVSPTVDKLSRLVGINRTKLQAGFHELFGETVMQYRTKVRLAEALRLLEETELSMAEIGRRIGFSYAANFTQTIKRHFGYRPLELRKMKYELRKLKDKAQLDLSNDG